MDIKTSFTRAHLENRLWLNELEFYREEIIIFRNHLEKSIARNTSLQLSGKADLFLNQFTRMEDKITILKNELQRAENKMSMYAQTEGNPDLDTVDIGDHEKFKFTFESFQKDYQNLKDDFRNFEAGEV